MAACRAAPVLTEGRAVAIGVTPERPGEYEFTCGMSTYKGRIIVR